MIRTLLGGLVGGVILFLIGFIFWATPLGGIAFQQASEPNNAALQIALAQNLTPTGTGAYIIPAHHSAAGAVLYAQGPVAMVHFNTQGFSPSDMSMMLPGFLFAVASGVLIALALGASGAASFAARARLVVYFSLAVTLWTILANPIFNHFGWGYWIYSFIAESTGLILAGLVIAKWFVAGPAASAEPAPAPAAQAREG
jgi:nitrate reductase NapE component